MCISHKYCYKILASKFLVVMEIIMRRLVFFLLGHPVDTFPWLMYMQLTLDDADENRWLLTLHHQHCHHRQYLYGVTRLDDSLTGGLHTNKHKTHSVTSAVMQIIGHILFGNSGPLCHALSLLSLSSLLWTSMRRQRATVAACDSSDTCWMAM